MDLFFGKDQQIETIQMELFVADAGGALGIAKQMIGATAQLAKHYSDELRMHLLGREDEHCVQNPQQAKPLVQAYFHTYEYYRRGLIFSVERVEEEDGTNASLTVIEVRLTLVRPKM